jgi:two-component system, cell cycle response regulator
MIAMQHNSAAGLVIGLVPHNDAAAQLRVLTKKLDAEVRIRRRLERELERTQAAQRRAVYRATHDELTGLANRAFFTEHVRHTLVHAGRRGQSAAVLFLDLNGFKFVNDSHGHLAGDELLCLMAERISGALRKEDTVCRRGGDEFMVCLQGAKRSDTARIAKKIRDAISAPCRIGGIRLCVSSSIGIAMYPDDGTTVESLVEQADSAMYWAKKHLPGIAFRNQLPSEISNVADLSRFAARRKLRNQR